MGQEATAMTVGECGYIQSIEGIVFTSLTTFDEFRFFTGLSEIPSNVFNDCNGLESIKLPNSIKKIGNYAFYKCRNIVTVEIPSLVKSIGDSAFLLMNNLIEVYCLPTVPPVLGAKVFSQQGSSIMPDFYVPEDSVIAYMEAPTWSKYRDNINPM